MASVMLMVRLVVKLIYNIYIIYNECEAEGEAVGDGCQVRR